LKGSGGGESVGWPTEIRTSLAPAIAGVCTLRGLGRSTGGLGADCGLCEALARRLGSR
jgi:hypothetical protein